MVVVGAGNSGLTFLEFIHALGPAHAYVNHSIQRGMAPKVLMLCGGEAASAPFDVCAMVVSQTGTQPLLLPCACWVGLVLTKPVAQGMHRKGTPTNSRLSLIRRLRGHATAALRRR